MSASAFDHDIPPYTPEMARLLPALHRAFGVLNRRVTAPALRSGLGPLLVSPVTGSMLLLRTRGRRSGLVREAPLGYIVHDGAVYVCAGFGRRTAWLANLRDEPSVELVLPGARLRGLAEEVVDRAEYDVVFPALIRAMGVIGKSTVPGDLDDPATIDTWFEGLPLVRIRPTGVLPAAWEPGGRGWIGILALELAFLWLVRRAFRRR